MKSDTQLRQDILDQLEWETSVDASEIGVTVKEGVVTLTGYASCYPDRTEAERITKSIAGVRGLANEIEVRLLGPHERSDTDIAGAALRTLQWNVVVPRDRVKVMVRNGWITLEGDVDGQYQRDAAFYAVRNLLGVKGVSNMIILKPKPTPMDVRVKIEAAFRRSAEVDARNIRVEARDGSVVLNGKVASWTERCEAERAAWSAPGVTKVENHLTVAA